MTLLDVAVAVVIVSLLLSSVVRGNELIESAHTKRISTEISNVTAAFLIYQDRYRSIPGDDAGATMRWAKAKSGNGDGVLSGHYDDLPVDASALVVGQTEGDVNLAGGLGLATTDCAQHSFFETEESLQTLLPLREQISTVHEHESVDATPGD
jgi:hypothetical protein